MQKNPVAILAIKIMDSDDASVFSAVAKELEAEYSLNIVRLKQIRDQVDEDGAWVYEPVLRMKSIEQINKMFIDIKKAQIIEKKANEKPVGFNPSDYDEGF